MHTADVYALLFLALADHRYAEIWSRNKRFMLPRLQEALRAFIDRPLFTIESTMTESHAKRVKRNTGEIDSDAALIVFSPAVREQFGKLAKEISFLREPEQKIQRITAKERKEWIQEEGSIPAFNDKLLQKAQDLADSTPQPLTKVFTDIYELSGASKKWFLKEFVLGDLEGPAFTFHKAMQEISREGGKAFTLTSDAKSKDASQSVPPGRR